MSDPLILCLASDIRAAGEIRNRRAVGVTSFLRQRPLIRLMDAVLAEITAIGSDVVRDLILGATPPSAFTDHLTFLLPVGGVAL
ncbi:MAG TPA: TRIC cation channel family protein [Ktedonobacterales bacterium]|nr:TRIC cation channel family protein [Ktedonobacterales bacterium]